MVAQQLLVGLLTTLLYWVTSKWRPLLAFSNKSFKELFSFGGFILLSNLFNTFCNNIQGLLIGKVFNASTLGYFTKARRTEGYSSTLISSVLDQVSYPVLSEAQNDKTRMTRMLKLFIGTSAFITFPLMLLLILLAKPLFLFLYSERWLSSVPYFQILCFAGIATCLQNINYFAIAAIGKSKQLFKWTLIKRTIGLFFVVSGLCIYGIYGLLFGTVLSAWSIYLINASLVSKYVGYTLKQQFSNLSLIIVFSLLSFFIAYFSTLMVSSGVYGKGLIRFLIFCSSYIGLSFLFKVEELISTKDTIKVLVKKIFIKGH